MTIEEQIASLEAQIEVTRLKGQVADLEARLVGGKPTGDKPSGNGENDLPFVSMEDLSDPENRRKLAAGEVQFKAED